MAGRGQVDEPPAIADKRRNPVDQDKVAQVIRAELCFEAIGRVAERCGHHSGIGDDHIQRFRFRQQPVGAGARAFQVGKIEFNQFKPSAVGRGVLSHLLSCSFGLVQIPCRTYNLSDVRGQGSRRFHAEAGRNTGYENSFALQIYAGQNVVCGRNCPRWVSASLTTPQLVARDAAAE
jgi:hypothetical protein